jgi:hypothetical protein
MKEPYSEGLASRADPESCVHPREGRREALTGACADRVLSREIINVWDADAVSPDGRQHLGRRQGKRPLGPTRSETLCMYRTSSRENREIPCPPATDGEAGRAGKSMDPSQR